MCIVFNTLQKFRAKIVDYGQVTIRKFDSTGVPFTEVAGKDFVGYDAPEYVLGLVLVLFYSSFLLMDRLNIKPHSSLLV